MGFFLEMGVCGRGLLHLEGVGFTGFKVDPATKNGPGSWVATLHQSSFLPCFQNMAGVFPKLRSGDSVVWSSRGRTVSQGRKGLEAQ